LREKKDVFFPSERESVRPITRETEREFPFILLLFQRLLLETVNGFSLFFFSAGGRETGEFSFKQKKQKQKSYHTILSFSFQPALFLSSVLS
jgi:hypothetical protein